MPIFVLIAGVALVLLYIARKPRPVGDRKGTQFRADEAAIPAERRSIVVATYNVQTGKNLQGQRDINRAAHVIKQADLVGIQEVYAGGWLNKFGIGVSQSEMLAVPGAYSWLFSPTRYRWFRENRGNAVLSKLPIKNWRMVALPDQSGISFRNMTIACFELNGQDCYFINTHLHTAKGKTEQLKTVLEEFQKYERVILVGDFNLTSEHDDLQKHLRSKDVIDAIAVVEKDSDNQRIDWILTRGWDIKSGRKTDKGVSDHPYFEVTLQLP